MVFNILPWGDIIEAMKTTFFMVSISLFIGTILAVILAFALVLTNDGGLWENRYVFYGLNSVISLIRSLPFIILMTFIFPFTKMIVGTRIGATAALVPLVCFIVPMGANYFQIIWYFILPEAKSSMILSITIGTISLISATAQAGTIGAGGIGDMALTYGYERMDVPVMLATIVILVVIVQSVQTLGNYFAKRARNH